MKIKLLKWNHSPDNNVTSYIIKRFMIIEDDTRFEKAVLKARKNSRLPSEGLKDLTKVKIMNKKQYKRASNIKLSRSQKEKVYLQAGVLIKNLNLDFDYWIDSIEIFIIFNVLPLPEEIYDFDISIFDGLTHFKQLKKYYERKDIKSLNPKVLKSLDISKSVNIVFLEKMSQKELFQSISNRWEEIQTLMNKFGDFFPSEITTKILKVYKEIYKHRKENMSSENISKFINDKYHKNYNYADINTMYSRYQKMIEKYGYNK